jgi:RimJ/RimL family protein N-acetyltransferase
MLTNLRQETLAHVPLTQMTVMPLRSTVTTDWRRVLPVLSDGVLTLRELRVSDAGALLELLTSEEVSRFISPPPTTVDGFERFIAWAQRERLAGRYICFAVVPEGMDTAVGIFQVRQLDPTFSTAEWGFAIGRAFWGSGVFTAAARLTIDFAFETVGIDRLEARAAVANGRGNGALAKIGAVKEAILRRSFLRGGKHYDQALWSIVREDWCQTKAVWGAAGPAVH